MTEDIEKLLNLTKNIEMTPEEKEEQRRSFAYGNTHFENERITREMVDKIADELAESSKDKPGE